MLGLDDDGLAHLLFNPFHRFCNRLIFGFGSYCSLGLSRLGHKVFLYLEYRLEGSMGKLDGLHQIFFENFIPSPFHHHHRINGCDNDQVDVAFFHVGGHRIDDKISVDAPDTATGNRCAEGNIRNTQRRRCTDNRQRVGVVNLIDRKDGGDHLCFITIPLGKKGTNGTVDKTGNQRGKFSRTPLAFKKTSRDLSRRKGFFDKIDGERKEIDIFLRLRRSGSRNQNNGITGGNRDGTSRLAS